MKKNASNSLVRDVAIFGVITFVVATAMSMLVAVLLLKGIVPQSMMSYISPVVTAISVFVCCFLASVFHGEKKLLVSLCVAMVYYVLCLVMKLAFFPGSTTLMIRNVLITFGASLIAGLLAGVQKKNKTRRRRVR